MPITKQGPSGGIGGNSFDDRGGIPVTQIRQVIVHWGSYVNKIEIHYDPSGGTEAVFSHGNTDGPNVDAFVLDPDDYLVGIMGTFGNLKGDDGPYVRTISFLTVKGTKSQEWGGATPGGSFPSPSTWAPIWNYSYTACPGTPIIAFFGGSGDYINNIGVYIG